MLIASCGGGGAAKPTLESASLCSGAWQALTTPQPFDETSPLVYQGGTLYYTVFGTQSLMAQPVSGGAPTVIAQASTNELWGEGDHLLFTAGNLGNQVFSVPFAGGTPALVLDGGAGRTAPGVAFQHAFTPTDFYWIEQSATSLDSPTTVWQQSRSGGTPNQIGSFTFTVPGTQDVITGDGIAVSDDAVLVGDDFGSSGAVPLDGSAPRMLAAAVTSPATGDASLATIDKSGAYWSVFPTANDDFELILSPADGSPARPFWKSHDADVGKMWSDGNGGWVAYGLQTFDDLVAHAVIWMVDAQGTATRLGCSPGDGMASWVRVPGAVAPDAIYVITLNLLAATWEIDRIAR
jgi:hypothetical protein